MTRAVRRWRTFAITSPSCVLTTTRSPLRQGAEGDVVATGTGEIDLGPALPGGKAAIVEEASGAGLRQAEKRNLAEARLAFADDRVLDERDEIGNVRRRRL